MTTVRDIVKLIETIADPGIAESWDNCGLQVGDYDQPVCKVVTALDPLLDIVEYACSVNADLLITHHPLIFKPVKQIDFSSHFGRIVSLATKHSLSVYTAHTSYDSARGGLNDVLAEKVGLTDVKVLGRSFGTKQVKLVVFTPTDHKDTILGALSETTAGMIGNYTCCSFSSPGEGRFKASDSSHPYSGKPGELSAVEELRIETVVEEKDIDRVVSHVKKVHPYETMAYDVYPLNNSDKSVGIGRIGNLIEPVPIKDYVDIIKTRFGIKTVRMAGPTDMIVKNAAVCSGSGSSLMTDFIRSGADMFISGDLSYHDARYAEENGRALMDLGHFSSENIMAGAFKDALARVCKEKGILLDITACPLERDPFSYI